MSVMSFGDSLPVWGGNTSLCRTLIENAIKEVGPKPYLKLLKQSFDHGYNHADMERLTTHELIEFRATAVNWFRRELHGKALREQTSGLFDQLHELIGLRLNQLSKN